MIPQTIVLNGNKEILTLNKISTGKEVSCTNGKLKKISKKLDNKISFRQMSHFKPSGTTISYIFSTLIRENMEKGKEIKMEVNLNKGNNEFLSETATCVLKEAVTGASDEKQIPSDFNCTIKNIENAENIKGLELISCDEISGIPTDLNMTNPANIDTLIESGRILDYSLDENKNNLPPVFKTSSLNTLGCKVSGVFKLKGKFDKPIEHYKLNLPISYPPVDSRCNIPDSKAGEEIEVICKTKNSFSSSKMIIEQTTISKNNSEVISILPTSSDEEISCEDYNDVYTKEMEKKFKAPFSFLQTQKFKKNNGKISFSLFGFKTDFWTDQKEITLKIKNILANTSNLTYLEEFTEIDCETIEKNITKISMNEPIEFGCEYEGNSDIKELIVIDSYDVSGIPTNITLLNPGTMDSLIKNGTAKNCSSENYSLPSYNNGELCSDYCNNGTIIIENGTIEGNISDGAIFNLSISPESYGDCKISVNNKKIECHNKEEIEESKILIPETVIRNKENNTELFKLKGIISDSDDISCSINNDLYPLITVPDIVINPTTNEPITTEPLTTEPLTTEPLTTEPIANETQINESTTIESTITESNNSYSNGYRYTRNKKKKGLSGGAIFGIILGAVVVLVAIISIACLVKSGKCGSNKKSRNPYSNNPSRINFRTQEVV